MSPGFDQSEIAYGPSGLGELAWEIATLFPSQGEWSEAAFLNLASNRLLELNDRCLEVLSRPTYFHELIVEYLYDVLRLFVRARGLGKVMRAPLAIRLWEGQMREPDILFLRPERVQKLAQSCNHAQPDGADLVMEVVSPGRQNRERDLEVKRLEYARAGIGEYWIVDPERRTVSVLALTDGVYRLVGEFHDHQAATSVLLTGFSVSVREIFQAGEAEIA